MMGSVWLGARWNALRLVTLLTLGGCGGSDDGNASVSGGSAGTSACSSTNVDACEYPSRGLSFTVRQGLSVTDALTGRELLLLARVPDGPGPFPVVVWSHGGGFNAAGHQNSVEWGEALAHHGYAVIHIAHIPLTAESAQAFCDLGKVPPAECGTSGGDEDATGLVALVKTRDVITVLDALPSLSDASVKAGGPAIDLTRVVVAGWSAGSRAPVVTHGAVFLPSPSAPAMTMTHSLPVAAVALSPMGPGYAGFFDDGTSNTWQNMRGPVLMLTGDNDIKPSKPELTGADRRIAFEKQPADGSRWLLYSHLPPGVGSHPTFNLEDQSSSDERLSRLSRALRSSVYAFLDARVSGDAAAQAWLDGDDAKILAGDADWVHH